MSILLSVLLALLLSSCGTSAPSGPGKTTPKDADVQESRSNSLKLGIDRTAEYLPLLAGKRVGLVVNHTTLFSNGTHLADSLVALGVKVQTIFAPEHGFRGVADAGATIKDGKDAKTGLPIVSLYGKNKKPSPEQLRDIDVMIFDIQDVGVRYYTYPSTMHYVMEACAENGKECIVLDRPNPNGNYVDGPVLESKVQVVRGDESGTRRPRPYLCRTGPDDQRRGLAGRKENLLTSRWYPARAIRTARYMSCR